MAQNGASPSDTSTQEGPRPLKIIIVGAGIGGLSAAIALRRNGHHVELYEQSRAASETGAAVHLAPNANGILRQWGLLAETFGACGMDVIVERNPAGEPVSAIDLSLANKRWPHPWHLVHRRALHNRLKQEATDKAGPGVPVVLRTASKIVDVEAEAGIVTLENGSTAVADVIVGADGIYSRTRKVVHGSQPRLFSSGKAAFRFLIQRKVVLEDPITARLAEKDNTMYMWFGEDRRIVMYPCNNNETLNLVLVHPDNESHAVLKDGEWDKQASLEQVLKVYRDFDPALKRMIRKIDESELRVWQLLDMEKLPSWTKGKLALLGDAAHPFTPHQGQGAGQSIEDAVALGTVLPKGTTPADVPERLKLYEKIRYVRAHTIQEYSRQAGKDWIDGKPQVDMMAYTNYNFGHDEVENSARIFKDWLNSSRSND
ncbi:FAD/NAD(P)-binding domain-containing protein [Poronia punctata]|nr:FAD/NAD(P)-binding domain-containing protein [Poronia punctata]